MGQNCRLTAGSVSSLSKVDLTPFGKRDATVVEPNSGKVARMTTIREMLENIERDTMVAQAARSSETRGRDRDEPEDDLRPSYQRDRDRIVHCKAFRRLKHKTQVFLAPEGDHYRTRLTHVLEVTQIARTIAKSLRLNEVLTEAIGLGHDLGHSAFGHAGEAALNKLVKGGFDHYRQSVRVVEVLENDGRGLNLTVEVRDGILKHSKGEKGELLRKRPKSRALTLEGDIVRISDIIAYVNHDIDDGIRAGVLTENEIPNEIRKTLGNGAAQRIDRMVRDVIDSTLACNYDAISMSAEALGALEELRTFMFQNMYLTPAVRNEFVKAQRTLTALFEYVTTHPEEFLNTQSDDPVERLAIDFIAGMTDRYAINLYERLFVPKAFV
jgi:dGTPase